MSQDRLTALRLLSYYWLTIIMPPNILAYNVIYNRESSSTPFQSSAFYQGSRKFGGYRIVPKACRDETSGGGTSYRDDAPATGVCMFNYECTQLGGAVVGSCVDVFLFGACCRLPAGVKVPAIEHGGGGVTTTTVATTADGPPRDTLAPVSFQQPVADTILYHRNGTAVQNAYRPDDMSADLLANFTALLQYQQQQQHHANRRPPVTGDYLLTDNVAMMHVHQQQQQQDGYDRRPPFSSGVHAGNSNKFASKVDFGGGATSSTADRQTPPPRWSSSSSSPVSKSTDSVPNVRKTTPSAVAVQATTSKQGYGAEHQHDDYYDNMVLIPTLTVHDPNVKAPPAVENNSIHHILSILNHTPATGPGVADGHPGDGDSMDSSSAASYTYAHPSASSATSSSSASPALYTWGSIETADSKSPNYGSTSSTFSTSTRPSYHAPQQQQHYYGSTPTSTSTHHLPGPHFHVSTTARPVDPVVPTVIVLSPANDSKHPINKYPTATVSTSTSTAATYSAHRPPPSSHVKPSQSIVVTGKPSVSAAYTTTATYHHSQQQQQQQQQDVAFVPVSSTTLADKYYNSNSNNNYAVHTSAKPLSSSAKPSHTTYGAHRPSSTTASPPPTLSSTVYNDVFTTTVTSGNHHQYHGGGTKYQPTTTTVTTARPVVNDGGTAAVLQSTTTATGYRPSAPQHHNQYHHHHLHHQQQQQHYPTDDDYPSVTPASQVFITASDAAGQYHVHQQQQQQQQQHYPLQQHTSSSAYPVAPAAAADYGAAQSHHPFNSTDTFAFPPVRDPYVNLTAATQQERPPDEAAAAAALDGGDYDADADPNPQLTADENLDDKVHLFVEKVVQSLQGNFEDLERVLLSGDAAGNVTVLGDDSTAAAASTTGWPPNKKKPASTTTTKRPAAAAAASSTTTYKPTKPAKPTKPVTYRPTPIAPPQDAPYLELQTTARPPSTPPTKVPTLLTPVQLFQPTTTYVQQRPTKQPTRVTASTTVVLDTLNVEHDHTTAEPDYRKTCGVRPLVRKNGRIVGGTGSTFGEWPWQVLVREATWLGLFTKNKCGGVLITQRHVITAAHCQPGFLANLVAVFGEYDISGEVESKRSISKNVKRVIVHRQYDAATFENDIALLELESPVAYDTHIVPICMPDDEDDFTGRMAVVTGWGRLKYGGGVPSILQEVQVPIIENQVCQDMFETAGHTKTILSSFLCAGYANGQRDSCEGDSGGPLMIEKDNGRWTLIGTVSHGIKCAAPYLPGVYMRTTYYKPWLQTITGVQ